MKKRNPKNKKSQKGSALVLTVIILVNALLIVVAISAISVIERKMSSRVKNSTPAFQAADSGIEWVLYKVGSITDPNVKSLADIFGAGNMAGTGRYNCPPILGSVDCDFYFVDATGAVIDNDNTKLIDIDTVRSVGRYGEAEEKASRAIEVMMEIAHCPEGFVPVSDFCIQLDETANADAETWEDSAKECVVDYNARLCTTAEWITSCKLSKAGTISLNDITGGWEWVDDLISTTEVLLIGNGATCTNNITGGVTSGPTHDFRCCIDIQQ
ncbi:MAG: pilus assembly PilX N-terminal domain-containing protein [Patescibacteria group bacterium]|nr:pilus assembly PilX N-terminal domain-containing protein [Patescibacteria group bacterium]